MTALRLARDWGQSDPRWFYGLDEEAREAVIAEWNIRQEDAEAAQLRRRRTPSGHRTAVVAAPPPRASRRPQAPANALALLAKSGNKVESAPDAAAFWFGKGLVHVS